MEDWLGGLGLVVDEAHEGFRVRSEDFCVEKWAGVIGDEEPTVWGCIYCCLLGVGDQVVTPFERTDPSSRAPTNNNLPTIIEIIFLTHIVKYFLHIATAPEIQLRVFVIDGGLPVSDVFVAVAVFYSDFCPVVKERVLFGVGG